MVSTPRWCRDGVATTLYLAVGTFHCLSLTEATGYHKSLRALSVVVFSGKAACSCIIFLAALDAAAPSYHQLMDLGWKWMLPRASLYRRHCHRRDFDSGS